MADVRPWNYGDLIANAYIHCGSMRHNTLIAGGEASAWGFAKQMRAEHAASRAYVRALKISRRTLP